MELSSYRCIQTLVRWFLGHRYVLVHWTNVVGTVVGTLFGRLVVVIFPLLLVEYCTIPPSLLSACLGEIVLLVG